MLKRIRDFLCGWRVLNVPQEELGKTFDFIYESGMSFSSERETEDGGISVTVREKDAKTLEILRSEIGLNYTLSNPHGMPVVVDFVRRRPMIPLGFVLMLCWLLHSENLVWDIKIIGNTKTPSEEIIADLGELGFEVGTHYPSVDFNQLHATYVASQGDIAWLSVYMHGTVAEVQVKELYEDTRPKPEDGVYANVIATSDGVVEEVNVFEGQAAVKAGDFVRRGQVLISGVVENKDGSVRYEYAAGEVICQTAETIQVKVEAEREKKVYTGRENTKKSVKIFKKSINLFIKGGIEYPTYDKIDMMEQLCPFGLVELPVWVNTTVYKEYVTDRETVPVSVAAEDALSKLTAKIKEKTDGAELISKSVTSGFEDGVYRIDCVLHLLRNIGKTSEFTVDHTK